jgi:hypothetical protein
MLAKSTVRITRYVVSCLPEGVSNKEDWDLCVEETIPDRWAIRHNHFCLKRNGQLVYEPTNSERSDDFLAATRFSLEEALVIAKKYAPTIVGPGGKTPADL